MDQFKEKVTIVTGGASGIGRALSERLGQDQAIVVVADINAEGAQEVATAIIKSAGMAHAKHLDVSKAEEVQKIVEETVSEHGRLDYMFNNAGILLIGEAYNMNLEHWDRILDINLRGVVYGTAVAYSTMVKQGFGHIVNTASLGGLLPMASATAYTATKHALVGLSMALRAEAAGLGVKVSVVCPGFIDTPAYESAIILNATSEEVRAGIPFKLMAPTEAARRILEGVARNKKIITFPSYVGFFWRLYRIQSALAYPFTHGLIKEIRKLRSES